MRLARDWLALAIALVPWTSEASRGMSRHATHVIDVMTYDAAKATWGDYFIDRAIPSENWAVQDICDSKPFPYPDNYFDFVIASHILEEVGDPVQFVRSSRVSPKRATSRRLRCTSSSPGLLIRWAARTSVTTTGGWYAPLAVVSSSSSSPTF